MPYADSRVTDNLFGLKPGSLWPLKWLAIVYTTYRSYNRVEGLLGSYHFKIIVLAA